MVHGTSHSRDDSARRPRRHRIRWAVRGAVLLAVVGYLKFVGLDGKFYYPDETVYLRPEDLRLSYENVTFHASDGTRLHGWFLPADARPRGIVVHFHGNAANISNHLPLVSWLPEHGYHVLMFDYRGFGESAGRVSRAGTIRDGHAALDYALSRPEAQGLPIFFYGQSLGGAVAVVVAAERPEVRAVVAESPFSSHRSIAALHAKRLVRAGWLSRWLANITISAGHDPVDVVARLAPRSLFVIGAEHDRICFPEQARALYDAAGEPKFFWLAPRAEHLAILEEHPQELPQRLTAFFEQAAATPP